MRVLVTAVLTASACARGGAGPAVQEASGAVRFAIELGAEAGGPVYVLLTASDGAPGWIRVTREGRPVALRERCDLPECGADPAVCGAALPMVGDLAGRGERRVELVWDGTTSVVDSARQCERRVAADPGGYVARFCYSTEAQPQGPPDSTGAMPGRLGAVTCREMPFTLSDREVTLRL
jgi:hypothetical protein